MYADAVSTGNLTTPISPQMRVLMNEGLSSYLHMHISRADAFLIVHEYLCQAICQYVIIVITFCTCTCTVHVVHVLYMCT